MRPRSNEPEGFPGECEATFKAPPGARSTIPKPERWPWPRLIGLGVMFALVVSLGCWVLSSWLFARALTQARRLMDADRFAEARQWLVRAPLQWSSSSEVAYRLGVCEHASGNFAGAIAAWERVEPRSIWAGRAGLARARTLVGDLGRFSDGEALLVSLLGVPSPEREDVRHTLTELYFWEGRRDSAQRLLEAGWNTASDPVMELRDHWRIESSPVLLEKVRWEVDRAKSVAPEDDRVWLAQASLAMQSGRSDEAYALLERCRLRRPDDPDVWRARLKWARAALNLGEVRMSLSHLDAELFTPAERFALGAWLAAQLGNSEAERQALEQLMTIVHDPWAMDRLALLAWNAGSVDRARELRRHKAELDAAKDRYRALMDEPLTPDRFVELAGLAESLGRRFEARGWWALHARRAPSDDRAAAALARLGPTEKTARAAHKVTLADLLSDIDPELKTDGKRPQPTGREVAGVVPRFVDSAEKAGLSFTYDNGRSPERQIPETTGGGVALLDYDGDGLLDVYVVQGGKFPPDPAQPNTGDRLFRNQGGGIFADATDQSGIARMKRGFGHGVTVGDIDNDGHPDLFITRWRSYALYRNRGDGTFEDITVRSGLGGDRDWPTSAALADFDNDGDLDLYVCHYLVWNTEHPLLCHRKTVSTVSERVEPGQKYNYCTPRLLPRLPGPPFPGTTEAGSST